MWTGSASGYGPTVMGVARVNFILYVRDQRASADFYRQVLAVEPTLDVPGMTGSAWATAPSWG